MNAPTELAAAAAATVAQHQAAQAEPSELDRLLRQNAFSPREAIADGSMDKMLRLAEVMASGRTTMPKHLHGNVGDCMAVVTQAMQWNMNPFAVAQKTHLVNGTLGYEAQLIIAVINSSPLLATRLAFEWAPNFNGTNGKDDRSAEHWAEVRATLRGEPAPRVLRVSMAQVGSVRNSPNWVSDSRQQLAYLAAKRWARLHAPDVILGVYTPDELAYGREDAADAETDAGAAARVEGRMGAMRGDAGGAQSAPTWPAEAFAARLPKWQAAVNQGAKHEDIVAFARSKGALLPEQEAQIRALVKREPESAPGAAAPAAPSSDSQTAAGEHSDFVGDMNAAEADQAAGETK